MMRKRKAVLFVTLAAVITLWAVSPALAQDKPASTMQLLAEKLKADKKLLVAAHMELTESEAKDFWPVYEEYQKELYGINDRINKLLNSYAADYKAKTLTDEKAKVLIDELIAIEQAEGKLLTNCVPKLSKVLPLKKVARYLQIENKIRASVKFDMADKVPLVP
ncbi:MAG: hypothetical protein JXL84_22430 [Deltaproteobacteria bacterium]|nr:hypothetical protein [Deltaproteobacteria bacterium]